MAYCNNFVDDFTKKVMKYNCCKYCVKRFDLCKNLDHHYNHMNPNHAEILIKNYFADEDDIDPLLTLLHTQEKLGYYTSHDLVGFIYDSIYEKYIIDAIKEHLNCINDDYMPYIELPFAEHYQVYTKKIENGLKFTEWLKTKILKNDL